MFGNKMYNWALGDHSDDWIMMAIYKALEGLDLPSEDRARMEAAYEAALKLLDLRARDDPLCQEVSRAVVEITQSGMKEVGTIAMLVVARVRAEIKTRGS